MELERPGPGPGTAGPAGEGPLSGAVVVLGVSGGIAAYKAVEVCRRLVDAGAHVVPVLTAAAARFVGPATFSALASEPAELELFDAPHPIPHTRLGQRADLVLVAPATARILGEYAHGIAADLLGATLLATGAPVVVCPAMHTEMWRHPAVVDNLALLRRRGVHVVDPEPGRLAGGDVGEGRLAEPARILAAAGEALAGRAGTGWAGTGWAGTGRAGTGRAGTGWAGTGWAGTGWAGTGRAGDLEGLRVLVTAGGTREPIDAVRVLANRSSGRQGHAVAAVAAERGAQVCLVTAAELEPPAGVEVVRVDTAAELAEAVHARAASADVVVMAAAVADFRPARPIAGKLAKAEGPPEIVLEATEDVLATLGRDRPGGPAQTLVGFAAEAGEAALVRARAKLAAKGADLLVVNDVTAEGAGFGHTTNAVTILDRSGDETEVPLAPKPTIAAAVLDAVVAWRARHRGAESMAAPPGAPERGAGQ